MGLKLSDLEISCGHTERVSDSCLVGVEAGVRGNSTHHLGVGPAGDLDDHVQDGAGLVGEEGDVVEGGDDLSILLSVDTVLCGGRRG